MVLHLRASAAHLPVVALHHQATAEPTEARETSIPTDLPHGRDRVLQDVTAHAQDRFHPVLVPDPLQDDVVAEEIVLVGIVAEDDEVQAIAATVVMMIEVGVAVVHVVEGEDVRLGHTCDEGGSWKAGKFSGVCPTIDSPVRIIQQIYGGGLYNNDNMTVRAVRRDHECIIYNDGVRGTGKIVPEIRDTNAKLPCKPRTMNEMSVRKEGMSAKSRKCIGINGYHFSQNADDNLLQSTSTSYTYETYPSRFSNIQFI